MGLSNKDDQKELQGNSDFNIEEEKETSEVKYIFTQQKTVVENGKKRIIPQMQKKITGPIATEEEKPISTELDKKPIDVKMQNENKDTSEFTKPPPNLVSKQSKPIEIESDGDEKIVVTNNKKDEFKNKTEETTKNAKEQYINKVLFF